MPHDLTGRCIQGNQRVGVAIVPQSLTTVEVGAWRGSWHKNQIPGRVDGQRSPGVCRPGDRRTFSLPGFMGGICFAARYGIPDPANFSGFCIYRAHDAALGSYRAVIANGRAHDNLIANYRGRRGNRIVADIDVAHAYAQVHPSLVAKIFAGVSGHRIQGVHLSYQRTDENPRRTHGTVAMPQAHPSRCALGVTDVLGSSGSKRQISSPVAAFTAMTQFALVLMYSMPFQKIGVA